MEMLAILTMQRSLGNGYRVASQTRTFTLAKPMSRAELLVMMREDLLELHPDTQKEDWAILYFYLEPNDTLTPTSRKGWGR